MLTVQHLSRLGPQGAIVSKGAGPPPLVTGRRVKPIIGEAWEIQYRVGRGRGGDSIIGEINFFIVKVNVQIVEHSLVVCYTSFRLHPCILSALSGPPCPPSPAAPAMWPGPLAYGLFDMFTCSVCTSFTFMVMFYLSLRANN